MAGSVVLPPTTKQLAPRALYEVGTGLVAVRDGPNRANDSVGILRGGHRFYGTPFLVGDQTWVKLESDGVPPPIFSPSNHRSRTDGNGQLKQYNMSLSPMYYSHPSSTVNCKTDDNIEDEVWVLGDGQHVNRIRLGRGQTQRPKGSVWPSPFRTKARPRLRPSICGFPDLFCDTDVGSSTDGTMSCDHLRLDSKGSPTSSIGRAGIPQEQRGKHGMGIGAPTATSVDNLDMHTSTLAMTRTRSSPTVTLDSWALLGAGAWVNFRKYHAINGAPPDLNCGRFRQLADVCRGQCLTSSKAPS